MKGEVFRDFAAPAAPFTTQVDLDTPGRCDASLQGWTEGSELCRVYLGPSTSFSLLASERPTVGTCFWVSYLPRSCRSLKQLGPWLLLCLMCSVLRVGVTPYLGLPSLFRDSTEADKSEECLKLAVWVAQSRAAAATWEHWGSVCS